MKNRAVALDVLRVLAAVWVLVHHWTSADAYMRLMKQPYDVSWLGGIAKDVVGTGFLGVDVFFVISGVVIGRSAIDRDWHDFAKARFLRLYPTYMVGTLAAMAIMPYALNQYEPFDHTALSLTGLQWFLDSRRL